MRALFVFLLAGAAFAQPVVNPFPPASHLVPGNSSSSSGTVTSVSGACGVSVATGTTTPVVSESILTTAHSGAIVTGDCGKTITEGSGCVWTIAQAGTTGFATGWYTTLNNTGSGSCTATATTSIFFGGPTANISGSVLTVPAHTSAQIISNGTDYQVLSGGGGASGSGVSYCAPASASGSAYTCTPSPAIPSSSFSGGHYVAGVTLNFVPDVVGVAGAVTVNANGLGTQAIKESDGTTNPTALDLLALRSVVLISDGTVFRLPLNSMPGTSGQIATVGSSGMFGTPLSALGFGTVTAYAVSTTLSGTNCNNYAAATPTASTITLAAAPPSSNCSFTVFNDTASAVTIAPNGVTMKDIVAPTGSTASRTLYPGQGLTIATDGTIYYASFYGATYGTFEDCATTAACPNTIAPVLHEYIGRGTLSSGTPSTYAVTTMSPAFTSASTYVCMAQDATTIANNIGVLTAGYVSGSAVTFTGPNTNTDTFRFWCRGY